MSLPVVLPGSCCPVTAASQLAEPSYRNRPRGLSASSRIAVGGSRLLLPGRPLLSLGLLQLLLGGSMVALSFGALSLSNSPPIRNSCPFWAGSSVILSGIVGLTTWRRPMLLLGPTVWRLPGLHSLISTTSVQGKKLPVQSPSEVPLVPQLQWKSALCGTQLVKDIPAVVEVVEKDTKYR